MNGWVIVYLEAKKQSIIPPEVLLEWIDGMIFLIKSYKKEYIFDLPEARERFFLVTDYCHQEKNVLVNALGSSYKPRPFYWTIYDQMPMDGYGWTSFGMHFWELKKQGKPHRKNGRAPEMASYAFKVMHALKVRKPEVRKIKNMKTSGKEEQAIVISAEVDQEYKTDIDKAIAMFSKLPTVPLFDSLRVSLACLYVLADRYYIIMEIDDGNYLLMIL